jgi:ERCC4-related helicase
MSTSEVCPPIANNISPKVQVLIETLISEAGPDFSGLVFVEQRVWVAALAEILTTHPRTKDIFNVGTYIGAANSTKRKGNIADLAEPQNQQYTLDDFRAGKKNLILATSVLEEGIDISNCHLVVCFEPPKNLKSFVQRRGRARKQKSKYIIFTPEFGPVGKFPETWELLEQQMKKAYLNDLREVRSAEERELQEEDEVLFYKVPSTGYVFVSHTLIFCSISPLL